MGEGLIRGEIEKGTAGASPYHQIAGSDQTANSLPLGSTK